MSLYSCCVEAVFISPVHDSVKHVHDFAFIATKDILKDTMSTFEASIASHLTFDSETTIHNDTFTSHELESSHDIVQHLHID